MEQLINNKKYLLIFILFILLLLLIVIYFILTSGRTAQPENTVQPTGSQNTQITSVPVQNSTQAPVTTPEPFTGARDVQFTETEASQIEQERNLRRQSPITTAHFVVSYNPSNDLFEVTLNEPKTNTLNDFEIWRKNEYPNVSLERFIFK